MKNLLTLAAGVLFSTLAFADGAKKTSTASVSVMHSGSDLIKVFYKGAKSNTVSITILNTQKEIVFSEKMKSGNFMRPYNFKQLPAGAYTINIEDESGKLSESVNYGVTPMEKKIDILKVDGRFLVSGFMPESQAIDVNIYDADGKNIYHEGNNISGQFARLFNLSAVKGAFSIEVSDEHGELKQYRN